MARRRVVFGASSITVELFGAILRLVPEGGTILELGSGRVSPLWVDCGLRCVSIEHDEEWCGLFPGVEYRHVPITGTWYDRAGFREAVQGVQYDLLLVDGPPGQRGAPTSRLGLLDELDRLDRTKPVAIDDVERPAEARLAEEVRSWLGSRASISLRRGRRHHSVVLLPS
ncbi:MAG: hypothetical protein WC992_05150 [Acholeplasmataceae bacterium]|jgi:hypothetical protein